MGHGQRKDSAAIVTEETIGTVGILHLDRLNQGGLLAFHCLVACGWFRESASCCSDECPIFSKQGNKFSVLFRTPVDVMNEEECGSVRRSVQEQQRLPGNRIRGMNFMRSLRLSRQ